MVSGVSLPSCIKFRTQLVFRTNAGHVKQGLRCKHCRVNIHQSCGAKVSRLTSFYMVTHRQSLKYRSVDIYKPNLRLINSPTAMWYSIYQVSVCQPKKKKRLLRRGKSFDAKKASRPSGSQNDKWVLPRKVLLELLNCLVHILHITLFFPVNEGGLGACHPTQWKTHGICP